MAYKSGFVISWGWLAGIAASLIVIFVSSFVLNKNNAFQMVTALAQSNKITNDTQESQLKELRVCYDKVTTKLDAVDEKVDDFKEEQNKQLNDLKTQQLLTNQALEMLLQKEGLKMPKNNTGGN